MLFDVLLLAATAVAQNTDRAFLGSWTLNVAKSDLGERAKPKMGHVNWGEHGWTLAIVGANGELYAEAVSTDGDCTLIGVFPKQSCEIEIVTSQHVRFTIKEGMTIRRVSDIQLLGNATTQMIHRVIPTGRAPYVQKTIWERSRLPR